MDSAQRNLCADLARALGVSRATKAVLTLEPGKLPLLEVTMPVVDASGRSVLEPYPDDILGVARRLAKVQFLLRLEPFNETGKVA